MVDTDDLISKVYQKKAIWDKREKLHANRVYVDKCWKEIATELEAEASQLRRKWKYLRDQYASELAKIKRPKSGAGADEVVICKWQYLKPLSFLKDVVKPRQSSGNCSAVLDVNLTEDTHQQSITSDDNNGDEVHDNVDNVNDLPSNETNNTNEANNVPASPNPPTPASVVEGVQGTSKVNKNTVERVKRKRTTDDYTTSILEIEKKKLEILSQKRNDKAGKEDDDEHLLFFKTLLPHVRKIKPEQILTFRGMVQNLVQDFAYPISYVQMHQAEAMSTPRSATPYSNPQSVQSSSNEDNDVEHSLNTDLLGVFAKLS